jgi:hypothetical protein
MMRHSCLAMHGSWARQQHASAHARGSLLQTPLTKGRHSCQQNNCSKQSKLAERHVDGVPLPDNESKGGLKGVRVARN